MLLLFVAFLSGAILMALELAGSRVLAPHFGGSIFVWGSLIGVFLAALSIGYYVGGRAADLSPRAGSLAGFLLVAGAFVLLLPWYAAAVCDRIALRDFGARANPLIACMLLFFVPGALMAVTSPFVIRLTARSISRVGRTAGAVYAVSTIGSIAGTLGAAFYLIPGMGTRAILYLLGALLVVAGLLAGALRGPRRGAAAALLLAVGLLAQPACAEEKVLLTRDSAYHRLFVTEEGHNRWLRADNIWHTQMDLRDPQGRGLPYSDYVDLAFLFKPDIRSVLVIGLGGGTVPKRFVRDYPQVTVDAVEIDPDVISIAKRYFHVEPGPRLRIHQADGRMFLRRSEETWDLIVLDAYYADTVPFFLCTKEFFEIVRERLTPGGVLVNNVVGQVSGARSKFFRSVYHTMAEVFPHVYAFEVAESGTMWVNIEVFGLNSEERISLAEVRLRAGRMKGKIIHDEELLERVADYVEGPIPKAGAKILTDDYAPVDALIHLW
jgi:spermidine synthase